MSTQSALTFIQRIRQPDNAQYLSELTQLQDAVIIGEKWELTFNVAELQQAYRQDWMMRWVKHTQTSLLNNKKPLKNTVFVQR